MELNVDKVIDPIWADFKKEMEQLIGSPIELEHVELF